MIMVCNYLTLLLFICVGQSIFIAYLLSHTSNPHNFIIPNTISPINSNLSSSLFCFGTERDNRECRFQNLCYHKDTDKYVFFHGNETLLFGLPENRQVLLDLSSVSNHTAKFFYYVNTTAHNYDLSDVEFIKGSSILFHRFNPENLMHVLHDDIIPLYHTQRKYFPLKSKINQVNFIMMDGRPYGPYFDLYSIYSNKIYYKTNFTKKLTCFEDVLVGLSKTTTWYQYGFHTPQGPIENLNYPVAELLHFRNSFKKQLMKDQVLNQAAINSKYIVMFSRTISRRIVNKNQLMFKLTSHFKMPVHMISLESDDFGDIVSLVSNAEIVIGVHGAHLVTSLFMKPSSFLVEIFPYAVPADNYTPYKTLAQYLNVSYIAWENRFENHTVTHTDWAPDSGGIVHLSEDIQKNILNTKRVEKHLCCKDPTWLFRIYQDTEVNVGDFISYLSKEMEI